MTNQSGQALGYEITNTGAGSASFTLSCAATGPVTCDGIYNAGGTLISTVFLDANEIADISVHFSTGSLGSGRLKLTASASATDSGWYNINVVTPSAVTASLINQNRGGIDRGLCFTAGAGAAAGSSCGDLVVTHSMPAYRTMGRDRTLTLLYNSATSRGQVLVAASVTQPSTSPTPTKLTAILRVAGLRDSADYLPVSPGATVQVVMGDRLPNTIPTGVYVDTLVLRNIYPSAVLDTTLIDTVTIVNRKGSEAGRGWGLAGVERLLFAQPAGTNGILWLGGDGSATRYTAAGTNKWVAAAADFRDTLEYNPDSVFYTRKLRHGVTIVYNYAGLHLRTINRYRQVTSFTYDTVSWFAGDVGITVVRQKIAVPGNDGTTRQYVAYYGLHTVPLLDSIADPGGRVLRVTRSGNAITAITDPDGQQTQFVYAGPDSLLSARKVPNPVVAGGWAQTTYSYAGRSKLTRMRSPAGFTGVTDSTVIMYKPWNANGLDTAASGLAAPLIPTSPVPGLPSTVDGPIAGTGDRVFAWVDRFGQPTRTLLEGTGAVTEIYHDSLSMPALVTRIQMPNHRWIFLSYNSRGNLVRQRDSTFGIDSVPDRTSQWSYGNSSFPDTPTQIADPLGRVTSFVLHGTFGVPTKVTDPAGHRMSFGYLSSGLLQSVSDSAVETWIQSNGTDSPQTLTTAFEYDGMGQVRKTTAPSGAVTVSQSDAYGEVNAQWAADSLRLTVYRDLLGRDTLVTHATAPSANPLGATSICRSAEFTCGVAPRPWQGGMPALTSVRTYNGPVGVDSIVSDRGVPRGFAYDAAAMQIRETDDSASRAIRRFTGGSGLLDSTESRSLAHVTYQYDGIGRLTRMIYPQWRTVIGVNIPQGLTYVWDTIPGDTISYTYDVEGRLLSTAGSILRTGSVTRTYWGNGLLRTRVTTKPFTDSLAYWYDATGAVVKKAHVSFNDGSYASRMQDTTYYTYDAVTGHLLSQQTVMTAPTGVPSQTLQFAWDGLGRRRTVTYPGGKTVNYRYDAGGTMRALWSLSSSCNAPDLFCVTLTRDSVDIGGHILSEFLTCKGYTHDGYACGTTTSVRRSSRYYRNGWLASQTTDDPATYDSLAYDVTGNIVRRWHQEDLHWHDLVYVPRTNRVARDTVEHTSSESFSPMVYTYSPDGSRLEEGVLGAVQSQQELQRNYGYDGLGRVRGFDNVRFVGGTDYEHSYDRNACQYDAEGRMVRACKASASVTFDGDNVIAASDYQWHFVQGPALDDPLIGFGQTTPGGPVYVVYWVTDGAGRSLGTSLADGTWTSALNQSTGGDGQGWQQAGGVSNGGTYSPERQGTQNTPKLAFFRNRVYDMQSGQWTQEDPLGLAGGLNLYQYAGGNPVMFSDPFGLCPPPPGVVDPLCVAVNVSAGFGDFVTVGLTAWLRGDADSQVDKSSASYVSGEVAGGVATIALSGAIQSTAKSGGVVATSAPARAAGRFLVRTGESLFGSGGTLNSGESLRVGLGKLGGGSGKAVLRVAGSIVKAVTGADHLNLVELGKLIEWY